MSPTTLQSQKKSCLVVGWSLNVIRGIWDYRLNVLRGGLSKGSLLVLTRVSKKTTEISERLGQQSRSGIESGTSGLPVLSAEPLRHYWKVKKKKNNSININFLYYSKGSIRGRKWNSGERLCSEINLIFQILNPLSRSSLEIIQGNFHYSLYSNKLYPRSCFLGATSGRAVLRSKLVDGSCRVRFPVAFVDLAIQILLMISPKLS